MPHPHLKPGTLESLAESENSKPTLSVGECQEKLLASLDLLSLKKWPEEGVKCSHELLREYWGVLVRSNIVSR